MAGPEAPALTVTPPRTPPRAGAHAAAIACMLASLAAAHAWSLRDGLFLDDHWHRLQYETRGWSWNDLLQSATVEPARWVDCWWNDRPVVWTYNRPLALALAKAVHAATGGGVAAQHAVSVGLHAANVFMVYALALRLTRSRFWSAVAGMLMAAYSHATIAVAWLAAQNAILQTALTLGAVLLYVRASRLELYPSAKPSDGAGADGRDLTGGDHGGRAPRAAPPLRPVAFAGVVVLFALALLSRENAVVLPLVLASFDAAFGWRGGGSRSRLAWAHVRRRLPAYGAMLVLTGAFVAWRFTTNYHPLPDVYCRRFDGPAYVGWWGVKLLHYVCSSVWLSPMTIGPSARYDPLVEAPGDCALMLAIVGVMAYGYVLACRRLPGFWIWPLWIVLSLLPVVPIMATPHSGYMPAVGFSIAMVIGAALRDFAQPRGIGRWSRAVAIWFLVATHIYVPVYRHLWRALVAAERHTLVQLAGLPPPSGTRDVYFVNLPFVNVYAPVCLRDTWGRSAAAARFHVLTYAPDLMSAAEECHVERVGPASLVVRAAETPCFSGFLGRFLVNGMRSGGAFRPGERVAAPDFDVTVTRADAGGVRELRFDFRRPLEELGAAFYVVSADRVARLEFGADGAVGGLAAPPTPELAALAAERDALGVIRAAFARLIRTDLYVTGPPYPGPR